MSEELAVGIRNARLAMIKDCGHYTPVERPQAVTALMRQWLLYSWRRGRAGLPSIARAATAFSSLSQYS